MQPCVLSLIDHAHPAATEFLDNAVMRDGLVNHYIVNHYIDVLISGRFILRTRHRPVNENGSRSIASRTLPFVIGVSSGTRTYTAIQDKKDHERVVGCSSLKAITEGLPGL